MEPPAPQLPTSSNHPANVDYSIYFPPQDRKTEFCCCCNFNFLSLYLNCATVLYLLLSEGRLTLLFQKCVGESGRSWLDFFLLLSDCCSSISNPVCLSDLSSHWAAGQCSVSPQALTLGMFTRLAFCNETRFYVSISKYICMYI